MRASTRPLARVVRALALALALVLLVWLSNLLFMDQSDAAKGWFDCGVHCTTTQRVTGGILMGGGLLIAILVVALLASVLISLSRRARRS